VPTVTAEIAPPIVLPPQASIQGPSSGYIGEPVTFDASGSTAGSSPIASYSWNFGDGTSAGPSSSPATTTLFNKTGTYQVTVVVTDQSGQSSSATTSVQIGSRLNTPVVWMLNQIGSQGLVPGTAITLQFQGGQVAGFAGCNSYTGSYTATANEDGTYSVTINGLTSTSQSCPSEIMKQEQTYLSMLGAVTSAQNQGSSLSLTSPQGNLGYSQAP